MAPVLDAMNACGLSPAGTNQSPSCRQLASRLPDVHNMMTSTTPAQPALFERLQACHLARQNLPDLPPAHGTDITRAEACPTSNTAMPATSSTTFGVSDHGHRIPGRHQGRHPLDGQQHRRPALPRSQRWKRPHPQRTPGKRRRRHRHRSPSHVHQPSPQSENPPPSAPSRHFPGPDKAGPGLRMRSTPTSPATPSTASTSSTSANPTAYTRARQGSIESSAKTAASWTTPAFPRATATVTAATTSSASNNTPSPPSPLTVIRPSFSLKPCIPVAMQIAGLGRDSLHHHGKAVFGCPENGLQMQGITLVLILLRLLLHPSHSLPFPRHMQTFKVSSKQTGAEGFILRKRRKPPDFCKH